MALQSTIQQIADFLWGPQMLLFILGSGIYFSVRLKWIQFRQFIPAIKSLADATKSRGAGNITPFQALMSALSGIVGNGNIAGVATAIVIGGPGAIFWMWISALILMATMYYESYLGFKYRTQEKDGTYLGGPMIYIRRALNWKWLAVAFAVAFSIKTLLATTSIQSNSMAIVLHDQFQIPLLLSCAIISTATWFVVIGGLKSIARTAQYLVPFMTLIYLGAGMIILMLNIAKLPQALTEIISAAFSTSSAVGGFSGATMMMALRYGAARGTYSNEAGTGSVAIMHATAQSATPEHQSLIAMLGVFIDTIIVCTLTALVILTSGLWTGSLNSSALTSASFNCVLPGGDWIVLFSSLLFGYSTLISWCFYGEQSASSLFGPTVKIPYRWLFCLATLLGATPNAELIWSWGDLLNGITVVINLVGMVGIGVFMKK